MVVSLMAIAGNRYLLSQQIPPNYHHRLSHTLGTTNYSATAPPSPPSTALVRSAVVGNSPGEATLTLGEDTHDDRAKTKVHT